MLANTDTLLEPKLKEAKHFRLRFRMPYYPAFVELAGKNRLGQKGHQLLLLLHCCCTTTGSPTCSGRQVCFSRFSEKCVSKLYTTAWIFLREGGDLNLRV